MADAKEYYKQLLKVHRELNKFPREEGKINSLSKTEQKLIAVLCAADTEGERIISTQLANRLGVTRSAVSQMVDKLESMQYVRRVACPTDRKIAYIELSSAVKKYYEDSVDKSCLLLERVLTRMGERDVNTMFELADCFTRTLKEVKAETVNKE